jgi:molybdopterin-guanine dinucleotide biosynthesis protein A
MKELGSIILAGGKSSRMGQDKGLIAYNGLPMIQWSIQAVEPITNKIVIISSNADYRRFDIPVIPDQDSEKGPLAGIVTGMEYLQTSHVVVLACDTPHISTELLQELLDEADHQEVCIPQKNRRIHPLTGIYDYSILNHLKEQLALNRLKMTMAIEGLDVKYFNAEHWPDNVLKNINTPNDLR